MKYHTTKVVRSSPLMMALIDSKLICHELSDGWRSAFAGEIAEPVNRPISDFLRLVSTEDPQNRFERALNGDSALLEQPVELIRATGQRTGLLSTWQVADTTTKSPMLLIHVGIDPSCTETLGELTRLQSTHQSILDSAGDGVYGLDKSGRCTFVNDAAEDILGWRREEVLGEVIHDIHHHSHADGRPYPREQCPIYAATHDGEVHRVDTEVFWHVNGSAVPVEYTSTPIWRDGEIDGAVIVFRDISHRIQMEQLREEAYTEISRLKEQLEHERDYLRDEINLSINFGEIIGQSQALKRTLAQVESVATTNATALILGESGVGKEMIARAIHANSPRTNNPLVKVNCASIPHDLFESEFFGHIKGSFTGAHRDRVGRLQLANGGTLFLDEVGEIPLDQQGKLLRALQEKQFERVGDDQTLSVDVRVIAATNRDLKAEVKAGRFREDLYYRLSVFPLELAPLRERRSDIIPLAQHFLACVCQELGRTPLRLTKQQADTLSRHDWPGNIRELKNVIERAVILSQGERLRLDLAMPEISVPSTQSTRDLTITEQEYLTDAEFRELEKANMTAALNHASWRIAGPDGAAALLGLKPSTLTYRMGVFGIERK